jgi:type IV fimbrial biogenesis protein FimT
MSNRNRHGQSLRGFSLLELLISLGLGATVLSLGVPALRSLLLDNRRAADINAFVAAVQAARIEAFKRSEPVILCKTKDLQMCSRDPAWEHGWMLFVNSDGGRPPRRDATEPVLLGHQPAMAGTIRANRQLFEFRPFGRRSVNGTVTFCDERGTTGARAVIISYTGRPRVAERGPGQRRLACP